MNVNPADPWRWYCEIPVVSRVYLTASIITTSACALDIVSPFSLYFHFKLIFVKGQVWRIFSNFFFFGLFSLDFLFHMYFLIRYCRLLEEGEFRGRTADFVFMLLFGGALMSGAAPFLSVHFLGSSLGFMMVYIWGRRNENVRMSFLGLFPFSAPYLPWVLLTFSMLLGNRPTNDLIGIAVGHVYYYFEHIYPKIAEIRCLRLRRILVTPQLLHYFCGTIELPPDIDADAGAGVLLGDGGGEPPLGEGGNGAAAVPEELYERAPDDGAAGGRSGVDAGPAVQRREPTAAAAAAVAAAAAAAEQEHVVQEQQHPHHE